MGTSQRKERQKAELRQQILRAAREIVFRDGFAALTMRKIAEAVEYAPGTIYLYFESRDEIAKQLCIQGFQELLEALQPATAIANPLDRLIAIAKSYVCFDTINSETYRLIFMENPKFTNAALQETPIDASGGPGSQTFHFLVSAFDELKAQHRMTTDADSVHFAQVLWTALHGIVSLKLTCAGFLTAPAEELVTTMVRTFLDGLRQDC